ncbi:DUF2214 family protein [Methylovirgula sp. 4M-Z18]|uniref:DUF2214 family protein n=1 Tax=Methylovirgula sp. 4M-Z18 TaxID=2293567 RepID=UPI000E2F1746|nr:DUF2214 family protein [Methylovirgula sp. 4M-Z18]RFB81362.1 DUF2214 family protein [Methylovirgula sp. 4M-Z18]
MLDLTLAFAHHLLAFGLLALLVAELMLLSAALDAAKLALLGRIDMAFGIAAGLILVVGFSRAVFAEKGWLYYSHNLAFWAKLAVFLVIGLLSIRPTLRFIAWQRGGAALPSAGEVAAVRRLVWAELALFALLPLLAAAMARGYGELEIAQ